MTIRRGGLALGAVALVAALATGSRSLGVVGIGFVLAGALTWLWAWLADAPVSVAQTVSPAPAVEGDRARVTVDVRRASRIPVGSMTLRLSAGRLGERTTRLRARGARLAAAEVDLGCPPRGVYTLSGTSVAFGDLLGLVTVTPPVVCEPATVVVRPRLYALDGLFSDAGRAAGNGRRILLRRPAGFDFHSVRQYEQGESLRRVHWPTTARRGQLMVKELEDTSTDGVVVVLDCDPRYTTGAPPDASFDAAVRAAGSLLHAHASRGRMAMLVSTGRARAVVPVRTAAGDLDGAIGQLAAAEPDAPDGLARFLRRDRRWLVGGELVVVTATTDAGTFAELLALAAHRLVSVVWIDAASCVGRPTRAEPGLLRLSAHGVPTAVVRRGDDLAVVLSARAMKATASG